MENTESHGSISADLVTALAAAQGEFGVIAKGKIADAGKFTYRYADLAEVLAAVRPALSKNGLAVIQRPTAEITVDGSQFVSVETILAHTSGAAIVSNLALPVSDLSAQAVGSVLTYLRRYSLISMLGVSPAGEDDDAQASPPNTVPDPRKRPAAKKRSGASENQLKLIWARARERSRAFIAEGDTEAEKQLGEEILRGALPSGVASTKDLAVSQIDGVLESIAAFDMDTAPSDVPN